jgi:hypothetical protein
MGEIVNLRRARKRQTIASAEREAAANRIAFGRRKDERRLSEAERDAAGKTLDAHLREKPGGDGE